MTEYPNIEAISKSDPRDYKVGICSPGWSALHPGWSSLHAECKAILAEVESLREYVAHLEREADEDSQPNTIRTVNRAKDSSR